MHTCCMRAEKESPGQLAETVNLFGVNFGLVIRGNRYGEGN